MSTRPERPRATLKTYSHLAGARRMPSDYELVTSKLLYYVDRGGFEVETPISAWYERHQRGSPLACRDGERFADPRATTYTEYTARQKSREAFVDGLFTSIETSGYDAALSPAWTATLVRALFPLRFAWHGFQMAAAYVGQMAPGGRITVAAAFQAADEVRRIQRVAYRMALLARGRGVPTAELDLASREAWMRHPSWQPLRETIERLLVTYDWGEAFTALDLCVKPALDRALAGLAAAGRRAGDYLLGELLRSFEEDAAWQRAWCAALVEALTAEQPANVDVLATWSSVWAPRAERAATAWSALFEGAAEAAP